MLYYAHGYRSWQMGYNMPEVHKILLKHIENYAPIA
jgi:hypothetical protein